MNDKIKLLLNQIGFDTTKMNYFKNGVLEKIAISKDKENVNFYITIDEILPIEIYDLFNELLSRKYDTYIVKSIFNIKILNYDNLLKYINYFGLLENVEHNIEVKENIIKVYNDEDIEFIENIEELLNEAGFKDYKIVKSEKEKTDSKIMDSVRKLEYKKIDKKENIIKGREFFKESKYISDIIGEEDNCVIECTVFGIDTRETQTTNIITLKVTDNTDSIYCKIFENDQDEYLNIIKTIKNNSNFKIRGKVKHNNYSKELELTVYDMIVLQSNKSIIKDDAEELRVELHTHTKMSQMDGLCDEVALIKQAISWGHKAIAITDHNGCQSFPHVYNTVKLHNKKNPDNKIKAIYGTELVMTDNKVDIIIRPNNDLLKETTFVVFDVETTGFNAGLGDSMIEIGAVKIKDGEILERFDELINPGVLIDKEITEITSITNEMVEDKDNEENVTKRFKTFIGDLPLVAHNAKFDISMLENAYYKYDLGTLTNPIIDTLELSRTLDREYKKSHSLSKLVKRYNIPFDEDKHHRADYDAEATGLILAKMIQKLNMKEIFTLNDLNKLVSDDEQYKFAKSYHINILATNKIGLKNLFKLVSFTNTKYDRRIPRDVINKYREGLLIGSGCSNAEVFQSACKMSVEKLNDIISFYDYVEVQPPEVLEHLVYSHEMNNTKQLKTIIENIITATKKAGKIIVATGDVHHITRDDLIYRQIIVNQKVPGGGRHPLARTLDRYGRIPSQHFRTTTEMLKDFDFLNEELKKEIIITNTNKIADMVDELEVIIETNGVPFSPKIENSEEITKELVYNKAHELYGNKLPLIIEERIEQELNGIIKGGFDVIYLIAQKLVKKSNDDGYLVGSRGSVGSSFVATMMGITEVNPLPAHYRCPNCKNSIFEIDNIPLGQNYSCGYDLPDMDCPNCNTKLEKEGHDMPFATFLGFDADKVPDIDLNFSGIYQAKAHEYTKELFGVDNVYRAGTIGTVAEKTAYGYTKGYFEDRMITKRSAEIERLASGCTGVKRTTGQHPGGIVVVPNYMDVFDFTPFQFPADDNTAAWRTTHFDYHAIDQDLLKLDILGHDDPTVLRMLQDLSNKDVTKIPLDDKETMELFSCTDSLGVTKEQIMCETGTLGVPEFGTKFVIDMLVDTKPKTFAELVKISGLSHGTDVWIGNAQDLIKNDIVPFKDVIGCRDDIMVYLMYQGMEPKKAFKIMEFVRKGKASADPEKWAEFVKDMQDAKIDNWFIDSCQKIKYMFPKAHAAAYVMSAYRIAWFKVHRPLWYYAAYFSIRCSDFDINSMILGYNSIKGKMNEIALKGKEATAKENSIIEVLKVALEATARGIDFANISINESDATKFIIKGDNMLIPPFRTIDGLGETVADKIVEERNIRPFISIEDLQKRAKISSTIIEKMRLMGILDGMDESSQLSLF